MKTKLMLLHYRLVQKSQYEEAYRVLRLMRDGTLCVGLDDVGNEVEMMLEKLGMEPRYTRNYNIAVFTLKWKGE